MRVILVLGALVLVAGCKRQVKVSTAPAPPVAPAAAPRGEMSPPLTRDNRSCGVDMGAPLTGDRVGAIRLGMHVDSVKRVCRVVRDTLEMMEGDPYRRITIAVGRDTLRSSISDSGRVDNVVVESARFVTRDSIRVGTPLARLLTFPDLIGTHGEGDFFVISDAPTVCGLSFAIDFGQSRPDLRGDVTRERLQPYATTAKVASILVRRCFAR